MIEAFGRVLNPYGAVVAIDEPDGLDLRPLKSTSVTCLREAHAAVESGRAIGKTVLGRRDG